MLDELILGGEIQETSKKNVLKAISAQDLLQEVNCLYVDVVIFCCLPPNSLHQQSLSFACLILAYSGKTRHESSKIFVELVPHFAGIQFWPWPNSQAVALTGSVRIIGFNNKQMVKLEKKKSVWQEKTRLTSPEVWAAVTSKAWHNSGWESFTPPHARRRQD